MNERVVPGKALAAARGRSGSNKRQPAPACRHLCSITDLHCRRLLNDPKCAFRNHCVLNDLNPGDHAPVRSDSGLFPVEPSMSERLSAEHRLELEVLCHVVARNMVLGAFS